MDAYIQANLLQYTCLHCRKQCACQAPEFAASRIRSSRSDGGRQHFVTEAAHPFAHGDDVSVRGHASGSLQDKLLTKGPFLVVVVSATSIALKKSTGRGSNRQSNFVDLGRNGTGGQVRPAPCPAPRSPPNPNVNSNLNTEHRTPNTEHRTPNTEHRRGTEAQTRIPTRTQAAPAPGPGGVDADAEAQEVRPRRRLGLGPAEG